MRLRKIFKITSKALLFIIGVLLFLVLLNIYMNIEISEELILAGHNIDVDSKLEACPVIGEHGIDNINEMYISNDMECLKYRLRTADIIKLNPDVVRYLKEKLDSKSDDIRNKQFYESGAAIISAYIIAVWSVRKKTSNGIVFDNSHGIVFDYSRHRNWLIEEFKAENPMAKYAAGAILRHGSEEDFTYVFSQFDVVDGGARSFIYSGLLLRCDQLSRKMLDEIRLKHEKWWQFYKGSDRYCNPHRQG